MNVAIIGAGVSGLSCAYELVRCGIRPDIFEKKNQIGDLRFSEAISIKGFRHSQGGFVNYALRQYGLELKPLHEIKRLRIKSSSKCVTVKGRLGYISLRGIKKDSIENQIYSQVGTPVIFNRHICESEIEDFSKQYDYVVAAAGEKAIANYLGLWCDTFSAFVRSAIILGDFNPNEVHLYHDALYCKNGFAYMIPTNSKQAAISLMVNGISHYEMDYYWGEFLRKEYLPYRIIEIRDAEHNCGILSRRQYKNIIFTGNAGGFTGDFIGVGMSHAIDSGLQAARTIIYGESYEKNISAIRKNITAYHEIRKYLNTFGNEDYKRMVKAIKNPVLKSAIYKNNIFQYSYLTWVVRLLNRFRKDGK